MAREQVRVVVLFEDVAQKTFLWHLAKRLGLVPLRFENCQNNAGVLQRLGLEVEALRERSFQKNLEDRPRRPAVPHRRARRARARAVIRRLTP
jgi:hypothetical protein